MQHSANQVGRAVLEFLVDAHVHMHAHFDVAEQLDAAAANFADQAKLLEAGPDAGFVLCLTECSGTNRFDELASAAQRDSGPPGGRDAGWRFRPSGDPRSILAEHPDRGRIAVVAGRQIVTAERLEVLGLGAAGRWEDGRPIRDTIDALLAKEAVPVLPWGFGKWLGRRGRVARELIREYRGSGLYLGDNGGRLGLAPEPGEFRLAREGGIGILPGSDTLPFAGEASRTASYGFFAQDVPDRDDAWTSLRSALVNGRTSIRAFGNLESPLRFFRNQVAMQYRTRISG